MRALLRVFLFALAIISIKSAAITYFYLNSYSDTACATIDTTNKLPTQTITSATTSYFATQITTGSTAYSCFSYSTSQTTTAPYTLTLALGTGTATSTANNCAASATGAATYIITCNGTCQRFASTTAGSAAQGQYLTCYSVTTSTEASTSAKVATYTDNACTKLSSGVSTATTITSQQTGCVVLNTSSAFLPGTFVSSASGTLTGTFFNGTGNPNACSGVTSTTVGVAGQINCITGSKMSCTANPANSAEWIACVKGSSYLIGFLSFIGFLFML